MDIKEIPEGNYLLIVKRYEEDYSGSYTEVDIEILSLEELKKRLLVHWLINNNLHLTKKGKLKRKWCSSFHKNEDIEGIYRLHSDQKNYSDVSKDIFVSDEIIIAHKKMMREEKKKKKK